MSTVAQRSYLNDTGAPEGPRARKEINVDARSVPTVPHGLEEVSDSDYAAILADLAEYNRRESDPGWGPVVAVAAMIVAIVAAYVLLCFGVI